MASVYQKRGTWYARVKDGTGAWRARTTGLLPKPQVRPGKTVRSLTKLEAWTNPYSMTAAGTCHPEIA